MTARWNCLIAAAVAACLTGPSARSQPPQFNAERAERQKKLPELAANRSKLDVMLRLDREVYFTGEDAEITIRVVNPRPEILEVPAPFEVLTGGVNLMERNGKRYPLLDSSQWVPNSAHPIGGSGPVVVAGYVPPLPPTIWLPPYQPIEKTFRLSEGGCSSETPFIGVCGLPKEEGEYRLVYDYHYKAFAQFRIVYPKLEQWTETILAKPYEHRETGPDAKLTGRVTLRPRRVRAAVLEYEGQHIVVVSGWHAPSDERVVLEPNNVFGQHQGRQFGPYRRVATSAETIQSLQIEADSKDNLTVTYTSAAGTTSRLRFDKQGKPLDR
jgi:hypothetical protein